MQNAAAAEGANYTCSAGGFTTTDEEHYTVKGKECEPGRGDPKSGTVDKSTITIDKNDEFRQFWCQKVTVTHNGTGTGTQASAEGCVDNEAYGELG